jgi:NADH dehydrogenase
MASLGHQRAVALVFGLRLRGFPAWWLRRTYYLFQMPRWDRRLRIVLDWTVALFFRPDITKVDITPEPGPTQHDYRSPVAGGIFHDHSMRAHS